MSERLKFSPRTELIMPEYGRNIQHMVELAMTIKDRAERNRCARTIIDCMGNMYPYLRDVDGFKHKLWDHLAIMSGYRLDIDYPYEIIKPDNLKMRPEKLPVYTTPIHFRHYGRTLERLIRRVADDETIANRDECIRIIANQMRRCYMTWNREVVDDSVIFEDLRTLSGGKINVTAETCRPLERRYNSNGQNRRTQNGGGYQHNKNYQQNNMRRRTNNG